MNRNYIATFFSVLFVVMFTAPTIINVIDDSIEISMIFSLTEEEKENESKENRDIEVWLSELNSRHPDFESIKKSNDLEYFFKCYAKPHLSQFSPPPEYI